MINLRYVALGLGRVEPCVVGPGYSTDADRLRRDVPRASGEVWIHPFNIGPSTPGAAQYFLGPFVWAMSGVSES